MAGSCPTIFRRKAVSKSRASLLRRLGSSTVARFVLIVSCPCFLSGNCMSSEKRFSAKLLIFVTRLLVGRKLPFHAHYALVQAASHPPDAAYPPASQRFRCVWATSGLSGQVTHSFPKSNSLQTAGTFHQRRNCPFAHVC